MSVDVGKVAIQVVIKEWTPFEPGVIEHDYYAPGVGLILEELVEGGSERIERVEITSE